MNEVGMIKQNWILKETYENINRKCRSQSYFKGGSTISAKTLKLK